MKKLHIIFAIALTAFLASCSNAQTETHTNETSTTESAQAAGEIISVPSAEFNSVLSQTQNPQLLDVRTPEEHAAGSIPNATLNNVNDAAFVSNVANLDKNQPVFVYCRSGARSMKAAGILKEQGFTKIYNLQGGFMSWTKD